MATHSLSVPPWWVLRDTRLAAAGLAGSRWRRDCPCCGCARAEALKHYLVECSVFGAERESVFGRLAPLSTVLEREDVSAARKCACGVIRVGCARIGVRLVPKRTRRPLPSGSNSRQSSSPNGLQAVSRFLQLTWTHRLLRLRVAEIPPTGQRVVCPHRAGHTR